MGEISLQEKENLNKIISIVHEALELLQIQNRNIIEISIDSVPDNESKKFYWKEIKKTKKKLLKYSDEFSDYIAGTIRDFIHYYNFCILKNGKRDDSNYSYFVEIENHWEDKFIQNFSLGFYDENDELIYLNKELSDIDLNIDDNWDWIEDPEEFFNLPLLNELIDCIYTIRYFKMVYDFYHQSLIDNGKFSKKVILKNESISGIYTIIQKENIESMYKLLKTKFINSETSLKHFEAAFNGDETSSEYLYNKIIWRNSIPLFCCLMFGYESMNFNNETISFSGIIDKEKVPNFYKKATLLFSFGSRKVTNRTLCEKTLKLTLGNAPTGFKDIYDIIKTVQNSTA